MCICVCAYVRVCDGVVARALIWPIRGGTQCDRTREVVRGTGRTRLSHARCGLSKARSRGPCGGLMRCSKSVVSQANVQAANNDGTTAS